MNIHQLRAQHIERPLGYDMERPVLTWVVAESTGKRQQSARVVVAADPEMTRVLHDSGEADCPSLGYAVPMDLAPRTRYYWQVTVTADDGDRGASEVSWFETGKRDEAWAGRWIAMAGEAETHPVLRRRLTVRPGLRSARLYICGLGLYEATVNGAPVTDEALTPFYDSYDCLIQYQTYDVTGLMRSGENTLRVMLGGGWYAGRFGFGHPKGQLYGDQMKLLAKLRLTYADGTEETVVTDERWECRPSPVTFSSIYDGERFDARLKDDVAAAWTPAVPAEPPEGKLRDRLSPPLRVTEELPVAALLHTPAGELVLDFGQVLTGWLRFRCELPEGAQVRLSFGELLQHDCFYRDNLRSAREEYVYTSDGRAAEVRPHFTFYGYRFVKVEGMTEEQIRAAGFTAQVIHSDLGFTGTLETSDGQLNRLLQNVLWGQRGNFLDIPTDCPQRDERMGWTGDAQVFCATASYNMYTPAFYRKFLTNMRLEQAKYGGAAPHVVPDVLTALSRRYHRDDPASEITREYGSCAWADAATVIPWTIYVFYGDRTLLEEAYPGMKAWVEWILRQDEEQCGGRRLWACGFHFADWLALDNPDPDSRFGGTDVTLVATAYYYYSLTLTVKAARVLGHPEDEARYARLAEEVREAFRKEYFTDAGCRVQTQTALVLSLHLNLVPEALRGETVRQLRSLLAARDMHLDTGFVGTPMLLPALTGNGLHQDAVTVLLQRDYPGWLYEVSMGATTVWERWNSVMPDGLVSDTGMNSMNHYAYGSVMEWMYRCLAGLNPCEDAPGFRRAVIAPKPDERLDFVRCAYDSASGRYECGWERANGRVTYRIAIPFGCEAEVILPGQEPRTLASGRYVFDGEA